MGPTETYPTISKPLKWSNSYPPFKLLLGAKGLFGYCGLLGEVLGVLEGCGGGGEWVGQLGCEVEVVLEVKPWWYVSSGEVVYGREKEKRGGLVFY